MRNPPFHEHAGNWKQEAARRTPLAPDAPHPKTDALVVRYGEEISAAALEAWNARVNGVPIVEVAHQLGTTIEGAKTLVREAHDAIAEDLKENLNVNRQLDLERIDGLLSHYYSAARGGHVKSADIVLKLLAHRAKLCGIEPLPEPGRSHPEAVLLWVQNALPSINRIVDALPPD